MSDEKIIQGINLSMRNFDEIDLSGTTFRKCNFQGASFQNADLRNCEFLECNLVQVNFTNANLSNTNWMIVDSSMSTFRRALMNNISCDMYVDFKDCNFEDADLSGSDMRGARLTGSDMSHCDLRKCNFDNVSIQDSWLWYVKVEGSSWKDTCLDSTQIKLVDSTILPEQDTQHG